MVFFYYEVTFNNELAICIKSTIKEPSKKQIAKFLHNDMNAFNYTEDDIDYINEISSNEAIIYYDMKEEKKFSILGIDEFSS